jgi:hypothetical protein
MNECVCAVRACVCVRCGACVCVCVRAFMCARACVRIYVYMYIYIYVYIYIYIEDINVSIGLTVPRSLTKRQVGHMSRECPSGGAGQRRTDSKCYNCGQVGHISRECPAGPRQDARACHTCGQTGASVDFEFLSLSLTHRPPHTKTLIAICFLFTSLDFHGLTCFPGHLARACPSGQ